QRQDLHGHPDADRIGRDLFDPRGQPVLALASSRSPQPPSGAGRGAAAVKARRLSYACGAAAASRSRCSTGCGSCTVAKLTAKPPSKCRTTCPTTLAIGSAVPFAGVPPASTAAPPIE